MPFWLRGLLVLAAGWGVLICGQHVVDGYGATMSYRDAPACGAGGDGQTCVQHVAGTVHDRRTGQQCTSDGTSGSTGGGTTCTTYHDVKVEWPGRTAWLGVAPGTYDKVRTGDPAEVRLWRGEAVGLEIHGSTNSYPPSSQNGVLPWLALGFLLLAVGAWAAVSGRLSGLFAFPNFGWLFVAFGVAWLGVMALFGGHPLVWGFAIVWTAFAVFWIAGARRTG